MTHKQNKKQLIEMEPKMTEIMEFINKDYKSYKYAQGFQEKYKLDEERRKIYICFKDPNKTSRD